MSILISLFITRFLISNTNDEITYIDLASTIRRGECSNLTSQVNWKVDYISEQIILSIYNQLITFTRLETTNFLISKLF